MSSAVGVFALLLIAGVAVVGVALLVALVLMLVPRSSPSS